MDNNKTHLFIPSLTSILRFSHFRNTSENMPQTKRAAIQCRFQGWGLEEKKGVQKNPCVCNGCKSIRWVEGREERVAQGRAMDVDVPPPEVDVAVEVAAATEGTKSQMEEDVAEIFRELPLGVKDDWAVEPEGRAKQQPPIDLTGTDAEEDDDGSMEVEIVGEQTEDEDNDEGKGHGKQQPSAVIDLTESDDEETDGDKRSDSDNEDDE